jgi:hypothetical protein
MMSEAGGPQPARKLHIRPKIFQLGLELAKEKKKASSNQGSKGKNKNNSGCTVHKTKLCRLFTTKPAF